MKIVQIVPEFDEGGVERHVLWLSRELVLLGHDVLLVTAGGKLETELPPAVPVRHLPVERKNLLTGFFCALRLARWARTEGWQLFHAHSRVPAWIAWWASSLSGRPWIVTAHALYSLNGGIAPFRRADGAVCVSEAVRRHLGGRLPERTVVIPNGLPPARRGWAGEGFPANPRFLFVGRLTRLKGLDVVLEALSGLLNRPWSLDVVGDGPQREEFEALARSLGVSERVFFAGFRDDVEAWMAQAGCLVFPSHHEGMGLVALEAIRMGLPLVASDLEALRPLASGGLVPPGDVEAWREALSALLDGGPGSRFDGAAVTTTAEMARSVAGLYGQVVFH
ncbi:glycosyltransferase family 4 protein [Aminithiophilus ramosus]|uniref:Glycosyltransferase family 4 protein n=1 Tax=Aminithiophilus ramosus TaxID=3029084 RepID=A0A9Q7AL20_9BACT|nr:glycosyltransferase family 4 protein [Aminithiophilus ramosus]QTX33440.1 glycosyltransferase family 4 protein [Aminithiophilus ramosus]